tara:strand:- start:2248 stop:2394 length:147 start_codon:yes stop_codon:yes gene_type:complete
MTLPTEKEDEMITEYYKDLYDNYKTPDFCCVCGVCGGFALFILTYKLL